MGEDCLFLNIWTKPQVGEKKKAVLIWLYGGGEFLKSNQLHHSAELILGFVVGSAANIAYNGALLADEQDVIVVTVK
jgi:cholinesterase